MYLFRSTVVVLVLEVGPCIVVPPSGAAAPFEVEQGGARGAARGTFEIVRKDGTVSFTGDVRHLPSVAMCSWFHVLPSAMLVRLPMPVIW